MMVVVMCFYESRVDNQCEWDWFWILELHRYAMEWKDYVMIRTFEQWMGGL